VRRRKRDEMGEPGSVNKIAIVEVSGDGLMERYEFCHEELKGTKGEKQEKIMINQEADK
jgi:hypothetical protein